MAATAPHAEARVLPPEPVASLADYETAGGGRGLRAARAVSPEALIAAVEASGLRGRGGAGFPTGTKWRTVATYGAGAVPATVVVNGAEGEPGTFKDRAIMRRNPHSVVEGALIAARAVGADRVVIAVKETFEQSRQRMNDAVAACRDAGWCEGVNVAVVTGPGEYLFGEETGLLEVLDGRPPFPRVAPPFRHGVDEVGFEPDDPAGTVMARPGAGPPPTLVDNVETMANIAAIVADGPDRFRELGTEQSPGTIVCTVSGSTTHDGVVEVAMGTPLADVIELVGGAAPHRHLAAALSGVANPILPVSLFATPLTYEDMRAVGSGLGACGFIVFDEDTDFAALAAGVSRFLAVESCGQCEPCKVDGLSMADRLARICRNEGNEYDLAEVVRLTGTVAIGARCFLATQQEQVVTSIVNTFPDAFKRHLDASVEPCEPTLIAPIVDIVDDRVVLDDAHARKQPDWTYDETYSGKSPVDRLAQGGPEAGEAPS